MPIDNRAAALQSRPRGTSRPAAIVGIGASAGGLEALEEFFRNVTPSSGLAFVVIQHLDPTHSTLLAELLQRVSPIPVGQIQSRTAARRNHVHVIPPGKELTLRGGMLLLAPRQVRNGQRLPIDLFFGSLAEDQRALSVGVILSGMGSDGTLGLAAIRAAGGRVFVQSPESARFDSMPRSAIEAGPIDAIAPAAELPGRILHALARGGERGPLRKAGAKHRPLAGEGLEAVLRRLHAQTGHDFSLYKLPTLQRRIGRRVQLHRLNDLGEYAEYLQRNPQEAELLFRELLIGVTSFFRDPEVWEQLGDHVLPSLLAAHRPGSTLRAWVAGCSTGEEAYTLAMIFAEARERADAGVRYQLQVFATDLDPSAIEKARRGLYPPDIAADVSPTRLQRYFVEEDSQLRIATEIRDMVVFAPHDVAMDPPFTRLDLVVCRNLFIYFDGTLQSRLLPMFHHCLLSTGALVLGTTETVGTNGDLFEPLSAKHRIYRPVSGIGLRDNLDALALPPRTPSPPSAAAIRISRGNAVEDKARELLLQRFSPPAALITKDGDIIFLHGDTRPYLESTAGKTGMNLLAMARDGLAAPLEAGLKRARRKRASLSLPGLRVRNGAATRCVDVLIEPLTNPAPLRGLAMVVFSAVARLAPAVAGSVSKGRGAESPQAASAMTDRLRRAEHALSNTRAAMQASQEALGATNEELQSANEELQSTNEELTTSREEMQSMNEELQTLNSELQTKVDALSEAAGDMNNLLNSTDIATLFLDASLNVRRYTTQISRIVRLIPGDLGRPITDLAIGIDYPDLASDARGVLESLQSRQKQATGREGRWYSVRLMPYQTDDRRVEGIVITFIDITVAKTLEASLRAGEALFFGAFTHAVAGMALASPEQRITKLNPVFCTLLGFTEKDLIGRALADLVPATDRPAQGRRITAALRGNADVETVTLGYLAKDGRSISIRQSIAVIRDSDARPLTLIVQIEPCDRTEDEEAN